MSDVVLTNARWVRGRKDHCCVSCGARLPKGQIHLHQSNLMDWGEWDSFRQCMACNDLCRLFPCDQWLVDDLAGEITGVWEPHEWPPEASAFFARANYWARKAGSEPQRVIA